MFCKQCGRRIDDDARFCPDCGTAQSAAFATEYDDGQPFLTLRPLFIPWVTALSLAPFQVFFAFWCAGFCGIPTGMVCMALNLPLPPWGGAVFGALFGFFAIPVIAYTVKKRTYAKTEYRFYRDRLEYAEGFWTVENKTIRLNQIAETSMRQGVVQKHYGLGTIYLATPATGGAQGRARSGISLVDIENPEEVYAEVQCLLDA